MKLLFIQCQPFPYFGIMSLSGYLKNKGIDCQCLIASLEKNLLSSIRKIDPDVIGFSALSTEHKWLTDTTKTVKENFKDKPIIVGGIHAILYGENLIRKNQYIDFVCTGEGEEVLSDLLDAIRRGRTVNGIPGLLIRDSGKIVYNERRKTLTLLDSFREDRQIYFSRYPSFVRDSTKQFLLSRGCPFDCSFCYNRILRDILSGGRKNPAGDTAYFRQKSPDIAVEEIKYVKDKYPFRVAFFADDLFTINIDWLKEFCRKYKHEIGLPFMCITRIDLINEEKARIIKEAGCYAVSIGIETGNETLRNKILNKNLSDENIIKGAKILKDHGIKLQTSNMFCIPGESPEDAFSTIDLNTKIKTDFAFTTILMPFPDTRIAQIAIEDRLLDPGFSFESLPLSFLTNSILNIQNKYILENIQRVAYMCIRFPKMIPLMKKLTRVKFLSNIFLLIFHMGNFLRYKEERRFSLFDSMRYFYRFRKSF